ncbi:hypothetical protein [Brevibacillus choshinensis]|nr:hypothetical protein [Brevibacillus choshinensis]
MREPNTNLPLGIIKIDMKLEMIDPSVDRIVHFLNESWDIPV